jgi:hypothetical protein
MHSPAVQQKQAAEVVEAVDGVVRRVGRLPPLAPLDADAKAKGPASYSAHWETEEKVEAGGGTGIEREGG